MDVEELRRRVQDIVKRATLLKNKHVADRNTPVNYACIFSQRRDEYEELLRAAQHMGEVIEEHQPVCYFALGLLIQLLVFCSCLRSVSLIKLVLKKEMRILL